MNGPFYHYTCDHGRKGIGDVGMAVPGWELTSFRFWTGEFLWLTDLIKPDAERLGLTQHVVACDRTAHRYLVSHARLVRPWLDVDHPHAWQLAEAGGDPAHWFVSTDPLEVKYAPLPVEVTT